MYFFSVRSQAGGYCFEWIFFPPNTLTTMSTTSASMAAPDLTNTDLVTDVVCEVLSILL